MYFSASFPKWPFSFALASALKPDCFTLGGTGEVQARRAGEEADSLYCTMQTLEARWTGPEGGHRQAASATKSTAPRAWEAVALLLLATLKGVTA